MNLEHHPDIDPQLRQRMESLAEGSNVGTGNLRMIMATARRRTHRRHRAVAGLAVASVATVTAVGVQQLTRVQPDATSNVPPPDSTAGTPSATIPADQTPVDASGALPIVPSNITWNSVDVDSTAAIGFRSTQTSGPGYAISTAPGMVDLDTVTPDQIQQALYRTEDGISWNLVTDDVGWPFSFGNHQFVSTATGVYALGTAAAEAGEPNVLQLGKIGEEGEWSIIDLPFDQADYDTTNTLTPIRSSIIPVDNGVLLVLGIPGADPRYELLQQFVNRDFITQRPGGIETTTVVGCNPWAEAQAAEANGDGWVEPEFVAATPDASGSYGSCETELQTWEELGLDADDITAIQRPGRTLAFTLIDGVITEVAVPFEGAAMGAQQGLLIVGADPDANDPIGAMVAQAFYHVQPDGTFRQVLVDAPTDGVTTGASTQAAIAVAGFNADVLYESFATGTTTYRDMSNLLLADGSKPDRIYPERGFVGLGDSFVGIVSLETHIEQTETATTMVYDVGATGNTVPATTWAEYPSASTTPPPGYATASTVLIDPSSTRQMLVITDGNTMSAEPVDELIGLPLGTYYVNDLSVVNGQIILTYVTFDNDPVTPNVTSVLVGTPNS
jgi:hypothetical protein